MRPGLARAGRRWRWRPTTDMVTMVVAGAALVVLLLVSRWKAFTSNDPGFMSQKWLAEYNAQHP